MHYDSISICDQKDVDLVRLVQARDEAAFKELMSRYNPLIWSIVNENTRQHRDAEEILMDIWMVVWENIIGLRKAESFAGWLRRIAFTACKRYYAKGKSQHNEILLNYEDLALQIDKEFDEAMKILTDELEGECIFGMTYKDELEQSGEVVITVIACMPDNKKKQDSKPSDSIQDDTTGEKIETSLSSSEYANQVNFSQYDLSQHLSNDASLVRSAIENSVSTTVRDQMDM